MIHHDSPFLVNLLCDRLAYYTHHILKRLLVKKRIMKNQSQPIQSYVMRSGRMTIGQKQALHRYGPNYIVSNCKYIIDFKELFGRKAPLVLEIGFGMGEHLAAMVAQYPENNYLGVEVYRPGVGSFLRQLCETTVSHDPGTSTYPVRVFLEDAINILQHNIADHSLQEIWLLFPDPWPKRRHHKRRLMQPIVLNLLLKKLCVEGMLYVATDHADYATHINRLFACYPVLQAEASSAWNAHPPVDLATKYEQYGRRRGHTIHRWAMRLTEV